MEDIIQKNNLPIDDEMKYRFLAFKAICHLRSGEIENCCANHNADSCLFPLHGKGIYSIKGGSLAAVAVLSDQLARYPSDLKAGGC